MSIFGKMDAAAIPTNPFFIEKGTYPAEVTKAYFKENDEGKKSLVITFTVTDETSQFDNVPATKYYSLPDPNMTNADLELLPADDQRRIRQSIATLKRDLCGDDSNSSKKGLGVDFDELNDDENPWNPESLIGKKIMMGITNYGANNEGVNVRWVNLRQE